MNNMNKVKAKQLGMPIGTAGNRLKKMVLFSLVRQLKLDICFQCGKIITEVEDFSIEHRVPWLHSPNPTELFFSLDNIAFSHLSCNAGTRRRAQKH